MGVEVFVVLVGSVAVAAFARWRGLPAPLVVTGVALAVSLLPFVPQIEIDGDLLLNLTLPPLLYSASLEVSFVSFKRSLPHIRRLGVGLVLVTAAAVGLVAWWIMPELTLAGALLLGAIVGPPDAVSAAAVARKLGLPRRVMTVMSGESLINDATSLTLVRVFAAIVAGATVTVWDGIVEFVLAVVVGVVVGLVFGIALHQLRLRVSDPVVTGTFGLLVPFGAYAIAEHLNGSGVLAVVAMGLYVGFNAPRTSYTTRQQDGPLWSSMDFLLESFVFAYIGLQFPDVVRELGERSGMHTLLLALAVFVVVLVVRPVFVYSSYAWGQLWQRRRLMRWKHAAEAFRKDPDSGRGRAVRRRQERLGKRVRVTDGKALRQRLVEPTLSVQERAVVSWAGMRGVVTLAMAAALPDLTGDGMSEGNVEVLIVCAFVVTVGTLLLQGLTLAPLIRALGVNSDAERADEERQLDAVRRRSAEAGKEYLRDKQREWAETYGEESVDRFNRIARSLLRVERNAGKAEREMEDAEAADEASRQRRPSYESVRDLSKGWLEVRRQVLLEERDRGNLNEEVMRELITAMDAEELALDTRGSLRPPSPPARG
ncbi:cation:proton antiporter [Microbacterium betulae]|uniref:Cation:proton antiporter n=1 Tax=Microbacterium betulae TaxID=2981139 RepID=A0AA97I5X0_9MICO|nr:cation:proton antiporter [Microbacterium sp. AB]WOF22512.1 cation:proton antiporter [Microbacterium sp. AB]